MSNFWYFLRQIFFPAQKIRGDGETEPDTEPTRLAILLEICREKLFSSKTAGLTVSLFLHLLLAILLSLFFLKPIAQWGGVDWLGGFNELVKQVIDPSDLQVSGVPASGNTTNNVNDDPDFGDSATVSTVESEDNRTPEQPENPVIIDAPGNSADAHSPQHTRPSPSGTFAPGGGYDNRTPAGRQQAVGKDPGAGAGENAVEAALWYLAKHQNPDGSWSFNFEHSCKTCSNSGRHGSRIAATSIALLPFLGAGYTHQEGRHQKVVDAGLKYLVSKDVTSSRTGRAYNQGEDGMYSHGLAAMALCEAFAMSGRHKETQLGRAAQGVVKFIESAQDRVSGGWRYDPNPPGGGDLSVTAWQVLALKSAKLGGLDVSQATIYKIEDFLDRAQINFQYAYLPNLDPTRPSGRVGTGIYSQYTCDATGAVLRMYLGWKPGVRELDATMRHVASRSPQRVIEEYNCFSLYYAYYSTLAMHHYGGSDNLRWFAEMRDHLVKMQVKTGCEAGSWHIPDYPAGNPGLGYTDKGGRILNTALGAMILETPYRIMPLYQRDE